MGRLGRFFVPGQPQHVIQRGANRWAIFFRDADYRFYHRCLGEAAAAYGLAVHAYVLMLNHVHLVVTPADERSIAGTLQSLGRRYVGTINAQHQRSGTLWEGRHRATLIDGEAHLLACCRYVELNPVRAGMVKEPGRYALSSYHHNALGEADPLITEHSLYRALGADAEARGKAYCDLFHEPLDDGFLGDLRAATNAGWVLGDAAFQARIAAATGRRTTPGKRGRPRKDELPRG